MAAISSASPAKAEAPRPNPCPKCGKPLTDAAGLGWCSACGYCRSLEETPAPAKDAAPAAKPSLGGLVELGEAVGGLPRWTWIMAIGIGGFTLFSLLPARLLPNDSLERALWTTCQIGLGVLLIFVAQLFAVLQIAPEDEKLTFKDAILPFRIWSLVCKRLPRTYLCAWLGSWGLAMIVSALIFVGGLPYWLNYLPGGKLNKKGQTTAQRR